MVLVPGMLAWETAAGNSRAATYAVGSVVMAILVLGRLAGLVRSKERKAEREAVLRAAAASFAGTLDTDGMLTVAVDTLATMVGAGSTGRVSLAVVDEEGSFTVVASNGARADEAYGCAVALTPGMAEAVHGGAWHAGRTPAVDLPPSDETFAWHVLVVPLVAREEIRGLFVVTVDRPVTETDMEGGMLEDREIEMTETAEEAVVGKEARVREELVVRKTAEEHKETVEDKVRHTEVEVDEGVRETAGRSAFGSFGGTPPTGNRDERSRSESFEKSDDKSRY